MPGTTTGDVIRDFQLERSKIIDLLIDARRIMAGAAGIMSVNKRLIDEKLPVYWTDADQAKLDEINKFLDAGLFGDREVK